MMPAVTPVRPESAPYVPAPPYQSAGEFSPLIQEFLDDCDYAK